MMNNNMDLNTADSIYHPIDGYTHEPNKRLLHQQDNNMMQQQQLQQMDIYQQPTIIDESSIYINNEIIDEQTSLLQQHEILATRLMQQQQQDVNQQEQFEKNVQSMFGIGQQTAADYSNSNNNEILQSYDPFAYSVEQSKDVNTSAFLTALCVNALVFVVLIVCYELFRKWFPSVYSPRSSTSKNIIGIQVGSPSSKRGSGDSSGHSINSEESRGLTSFNVSKHVQSARAVNINTQRPLSWIPGVINASWSTVRSTGGLDSYMFLRYVRLCFRITFTSAIWACLILWPVYATADGGAKGWYFLSMANVSQGSQRLWVPTIFQWLQTLYVIFLMSEEYKHYLECRVDFLARGDGMVTSQQHMYSLIVERIPHELRSDRALYDYFNRLFPQKVYSTAVVLNLPDLEKESQKRKRVLRRLEKSMVSLEVRGRRPRHVVGRKRLRCCGIETSPIFASFGGYVDISFWLINVYCNFTHTSRHMILMQ